VNKYLIRSRILDRIINPLYSLELYLADIAMRCIDCNGKSRSQGIMDTDMMMIHNELWNSITSKREQNGCILCIECMESRLGRKITWDDLMKVPLNHDHLSNPRFKPG